MKRLMILLLICTSASADTQIPVSLNPGDSQNLPGPTGFTYQVSCTAAVAVHVYTCIDKHPGPIGPDGISGEKGIPSTDPCVAINSAIDRCREHPSNVQLGYCSINGGGTYGAGVFCTDETGQLVSLSCNR